MSGWRTRTSGSLRQVGAKFRLSPSSQKLKSRLHKVKNTMFYGASGKYADIVKISSPEEARESVEILKKEYMSAETQKKRMHIAKAANLAANRAQAFLKRKDLKTKTYSDMAQVTKIYRTFVRNPYGHPGM